jgi:hypothetical protein
MAFLQNRKNGGENGETMHNALGAYVRIFPNILWATINCSFGFMKNGFDVI